MSHPVNHRFLASILSGRVPDVTLQSLSSSDWEDLVRLGQEQGVAPLLYWALSQSGKLDLLREVLQHGLRATYFVTRMNNEQIVRELEVLAGFFDRAGIPVVALKGVCFALTVYPDLGLRPMVDLDLLVPASELAAALQIARSAGYVNAVPEAAPGLDELCHHAPALKKTTRPFIRLELHTSLVAEESFTHAVPVDWFWNQTEPLKSMSGYARYPHLLMLTPTAQLLYACAHAMLQHGGRNTSLRWLFDLDRLVRVHAQRLDWDLFRSQARAFEWSSAAAAALSQVLQLFNTPVPGSVLAELARIRDRNSERVAALQSPPATHTLEEYEKLKSLGWRGRFRLFLGLAVPMPAYMRWRYGLNESESLSRWYLRRWWVIFKDAAMTASVILRKVRTRLRNTGNSPDELTEKRKP